jgi:hypothetical protein
MIKITAQQAAHNFSTLAAILLASAQSEKALDFARRTIARVEDRGAEWMAKNAVTLQILSPYWAPEDDAAQGVPVADNRAYFMAQLQVALNA